MGRPATQKRDRLIDAAMTRFHHNGVAGASLAAVARDADVPPGNVYYYFQSKDALTDAVIDRWCARIAATLADYEAQPEPLDRVRAFLARAADRRMAYADLGCPLAALDSDLRGSPAAARSGRPLGVIRTWLAHQFTLAGHAAPVAEADFCLAALQGSFAIAHAAHDPAIIANATNRLIDWIGTQSRPI